MKRFGACLLLLGAAFLALVGCVRPEVRPGQAGKLFGTVAWEGTIPEQLKLPVNKDVDVCDPDGKGFKLDERLVVDPATRGLADCVVWLKGISGGSALPPTLLDPRGGVFRPHVLLIGRGQPLQVINPDRIGFCVHLLSQVNPPSNHAIAKFKAKTTIREDLGMPEFVPVTDDCHPWMSCWMAVMENGYAAKTDATGAFRIEGVPPGKYTLALWHEPVEKGGKPLLREQEVLVEAGKAAEAGFRLKTD